MLNRNRVFATNSNFLIHISLQPDVVDHTHFKLQILLDKIIFATLSKVYRIRLQIYMD